MWRKLLPFILLLSLSACSNSGRLTRSAGQPPLYIAHHYYVDDELDLLWGKDGLPDFPPAIFVLSGLDQNLSPPILGQGNVADFLAELKTRGKTPRLFLAFYASENVFDKICSGGLNDEMTALATSLTGYEGEIFLAIGLEPNSAMLPTRPDQFLSGYACVQDFLLAEGLANIQYGLHLFGQGPNFRNLPVNTWYPEGARVDFMGTTGSRLTPKLMRESSRFTERNHPAIFRMAEDKKLPFYVLNSNPFALGYSSGVRGDSLYQGWYVPTLEFVANEPRILGFGHQSRFITEDSIIAETVRSLLKDWYTEAP